MTLKPPLGRPAALPVQVPLATRPLNMLASLRASRENVLSIIPEVALRLPIVSGRTGKRWHMLMQPAAIRRILLENLDNYPKSVITKNLLRPAVGESLFIAEGAHWRWQRRTAAPVFSHRNVMNLAPVMSAAAARSVDRIAAAGPRAVDLMQEMVTVTFDVISAVTFSSGAGFERDAVHRAIDAYIAEAGKISLFDILGFPDWVPRPGRAFGAGGVADMRKVADRAIADRARRGTEGVPDLLDLLRDGTDPESGRRMTPAELRDNLLTFIVAGHETTALALSWSLYLLAFDQAAQDRARAEARAVVRDGVAQGADLPGLTFIRQVVDEALRLYPPGGLVSRTAQGVDELCGTRIEPGDTVMIPIYAVHRHFDLWEAPHAFRPDRWSARKPDRYAYLPFGDGPRICIGASFALQETVIVLATLLANFRFTAVKGRDPKPVMILTLRPEGGVWLEAERL
ncbi:cytochrome P450 [Maliponia aquimaris]|uniref:Putative bifunctional P-450/NADPH-P450 reductase 2 n=1 Tax=Maliponia aquimaris TaxID=1673631 RepID=A0A238KVE0_9RHOB|nr:cytochrome P450 [Maliponia aquimaris]SMX46677.1 putative bifunctional P-450/NADPH-P450 reductase 2 [Maliponia aquimaris]